MFFFPLVPQHTGGWSQHERLEKAPPSPPLSVKGAFRRLAPSLSAVPGVFKPVADKNARRCRSARSPRAGSPLRKPRKPTPVRAAACPQTGTRGFLPLTHRVLATHALSPRNPNTLCLHFFVCCPHLAFGRLDGELRTRIDPLLNAPRRDQLSGFYAQGALGFIPTRASVRTPEHDPHWDDGGFAGWETSSSLLNVRKMRSPAGREKNSGGLIRPRRRSASA